MKIQVLFFGATAEETGERETEFDFERGTKAVEAFEKIVAVYPNLQKRALLFAVNQEYSNGGETIKENDELAIFTAVSGG
jgi:molybdopterin converting factor small subunit